jgi:hypothetical protein
MHLKYLGGKTDHNKYVHVFYLTEFAKLDGWLPDEEKLNLALSLEKGMYVKPTLWGYHIFEVKTM